MKRSAIVAVAIAYSTAAIAQVGTDPVDNKVPADEVPAPSMQPAQTTPSTIDDAAPSDRADAPAARTPAPGYSTDASAPPPKR